MVLDGDSDSQDAIFVVQGLLGVKTGELASFKDVVSDNHSTPVAADVASRHNVAWIQTSKMLALNTLAGRPAAHGAGGGGCNIALVGSGGHESRAGR